MRAEEECDSHVEQGRRRGDAGGRRESAKGKDGCGVGANAGAGWESCRETARAWNWEWGY